MDDNSISAKGKRMNEWILVKKGNKNKVIGKMICENWFHLNTSIAGAYLWTIVGIYKLI